MAAQKEGKADSKDLTRLQMKGTAFCKGQRQLHIAPFLLSKVTNHLCPVPRRKPWGKELFGESLFSLIEYYG